MLANDDLIDNEIENRISMASTSFGRLYNIMWNQKGIDLLLQTKLKVYLAIVLTNLLYGCETRTCYRRHYKARYLMRHLRMLLNMKWQIKAQVSRRC